MLQIRVQGNKRQGRSWGVKENGIWHKKNAAEKLTCSQVMNLAAPIKVK